MDPKMMIEQGIAFAGRTEVKVLSMEPGYVKMMMPLVLLLQFPFLRPLPFSEFQFQFLESLTNFWKIE